MKIGILSRKAELYSTNRLVEAATKRGHEVEVIHPLRCYMNIVSKKPSIHFAGKELTGFDAVIPRIGESITYYGTAVVRQFEVMGVYSVNESVAISRSRDKLRCLQLLARKGVGMPTTAFGDSPDDFKDLLSLVKGPPHIVKLVSGTHGQGVVMSETKKATESVIDAFAGLDAPFLLQEFISESGGSDIRCFIVGDRVIASMKRTAKEGEFRSNIHRGGEAKIIKITPEERATAVKAANVMGLNVAGVDLLRSNKGPLVLEVNSSPGLEGIEKATGKDVASSIIEFIEKNAKPWRTRTQGKG